MARKTDRGPYRAIPVVLLDGKDFHRLPERARWVFVALKMNLGPAGIEVHYPDALAHQLAAQTGASPGAVMDAIDLLESEKWIQREGNVVWIIEQLHFDPHMTVTDPKHRKSVQRHIASLPRLPIVDDFVATYADWFDGEPEGQPRASEGPSEAVATTEDRRQKTEKKNENQQQHDTREDGGRAAAVLEMQTALNEDASKLNSTHANRLRAGARSLIDGTDIATWRDPRSDAGDPIPWEARPRLFRLAMDRCSSQGEITAAALSAAIKYVKKQQLDPFPERPRMNEKPQSNETRTGRAVRIDGHDPEMEKRRRDREDVERADAWAREHPDEANAITADVAAEMGSDVRWKGTPAGILRAAQSGEIRRRILEKLKPTAA